MKKSRNIYYLAQVAIIAGLYAVLTFVAAAVNLAYGPIQFRFSEALTILPVFTPAAVPGLAIGCLISNLVSPLGVIDWVLGTLATLLAAITARAVRKIRIWDIPVLSPLMPVIFNAFIIGFEIAALSETGVFALSNVTMTVFWTQALSVGIGELVVCYALGVPLYLAIHRTGLEKKMFALSQ